MARTGSSAFRKGVVYAAVTLALVALAFLFIGDCTLLAIGKNLEARGRTEASTTTFQMLLNLFPDSEYAAEGLLHMAKSLPPERPLNQRPTPTVGVPILPEMVYIGGRTYTEYWRQASGNQNVSGEKIAYLEQVLDNFPDSKWRLEAIAELGYTMIGFGRYDEAATFLQQVWDAPNYRESDPWVGLWLAQAYLNVGKPDRAFQILAESSEELEESSPDLLYTIALAFENLGAYDQALEIVTTHSGMEDIRFRLDRTKAQTTGTGEPPSLIGQITLNDQSVVGIRVFLVRDIPGPNLPSPTAAVAQATTDAAGSFELYGISPGAYHVTLGLPVQMAIESSISFEPAIVEIREGETAEVSIRFERSPFITHAEVVDLESFPVLELAWEEDLRATAYQIGIVQEILFEQGGRGRGVVPIANPDQWTFEGTEAHGSLEDLYGHAFDRPYRPLLEAEDEVDLTRILGFRHPGVSAYVFVQPIDADGQRHGNADGVVRGQYNARRNMARVELPARRSPADELLLQRDYVGAIAAYKERLEHSPNDVHSLFALWVLFSDGTDGAGSNKDANLARHYGERLLELVENSSVRRWIEEFQE